MSNLEHVFELALSSIEKGISYAEWCNIMYYSKCTGNAKSVDLVYRDKGPVIHISAVLNDNRRIWLSDIWELAQYTHPLIQEGK